LAGAAPRNPPPPREIIAGFNRSNFQEKGREGKGEWKGGGGR